MKAIFLLAFVAISMSLAQARPSIHGLGFGTDIGPCPPVKTVKIPDLQKAMILWWRPYRSRFNSQEPIMKCLSTDWSKLEGRKFKVIDYNQEKDSGKKFVWNGYITARENDTSNWDIEFDESANNMKVNAQILDYIEDEYMFMYVCVPEDGRHTRNGIIFTKEKHVSAEKMDLYFDRAYQTTIRNHIQPLNEMLPIDLSDCPDP